MVLGLSFLLLVSLVISTGLTVINNYFNSLFGGFGGLAEVINFAVSTLVIGLMFSLIFKVLPDIEIAWKDVWVGGFITAILFNMGKSLIGLYLGNSAVASVYGAAGSLIVLLLWVYYSAQILFFGAEFTQVYARRYRSLGNSETNAQRADHLSAQSSPTRLDEVMIPVVGQPRIRAQPL